MIMRRTSLNTKFHLPVWYANYELINYYLQKRSHCKTFVEVKMIVERK